MNGPNFFKLQPPFCAMVLATTRGSRLFPMTSSEMPKHLLPIAGIPCILRLLESLANRFPQIVIAIAADDSQTLAVVQEVAILREPDPLDVMKESSSPDPAESEKESVPKIFTLDMKNQMQTITIIKLEDDCFGPIAALRQVEETKVIHEATRLVVMPGDLVFLRNDIKLDALLRPPEEAACVALLVDVGELDEHGVPQKESSKAKKGGLARDEEDIDFIGLSYPYCRSTRSETASVLPRIVLKQSKLKVEADEDMTGTTAKLEIPKARLRHGKLSIRTEWSDVHVYSLAPWVRKLILTRTKLSSFDEDLLPLLISRQFRGTNATFGKSLQEVHGNQKENQPQQGLVGNELYSILALMLETKTMLRANTISAFLFACREAVANGASLAMPPESKWNGKFQSLVLSDSTLGAKITMKSSIVGKGCQVGSKSRINNVVIMDNVIIGENCSLQNTLIGPGAKLGNNVSLNDCQVGPGKELPAGTKEKGESFMVGDVMEEEIL